MRPEASPANTNQRLCSPGFVRFPCAPMKAGRVDRDGRLERNILPCPGESTRDRSRHIGTGGSVDGCPFRTGLS
jgi:hypothetical protein